MEIEVGMKSADENLFKQFGVGEVRLIGLLLFGFL